MWLAKFFQTISANGGWRQSTLTLARYDVLKIGTFMGCDRFGNRYYENPYYNFMMSRWSIHSDQFGYDYDGSQTDCQWYRWLSYVTDELPYEESTRVTYHWMLMHTENATGTKNQYVPYSTTSPKIIPWKPPNSPKVAQKPCDS